MNLDEAKRLAIRIINSWQGGPTIDEWISELTDMDAGTAGTTFVRLRRDLERPPTIARFWHTYAELATSTNQALPCIDCEGTGWITGYTDQRGYRYAKPCAYCKRGEQAAKRDMEPSGPFFTQRSPQGRQL